MTLEIYHQIGHNHKWNFQSLKDDKTGQGVILSPRFLSPTDIVKQPPDIIRSSIFDPQFFLPDTALGKLSDYDFFPDSVADGFKTNDYSDSYAQESAERCVKFQIQNDFRYIVIPTRYSAGMPTSFIQSQQELFVTPFLEAINKQQSSQKVVLQLVLNDNMIKDKEYAADLLNWITGIDTLNGVYLIVEASPRSKQLADADLLFAMLTFIDALVQNQLEVILGYLNTESFLLSIASPQIITMGTYENTRTFNIRNFEVKEKTVQQGPTARLYVSKLLQWVSYPYIGAISRALTGETNFFDENRHQALMFKPSYRWHFSKPELYKHALLVFEQQLRNIGVLQGKERYEAVRSTIRNAMSYYAKIEAGGVVFDRDSSGEHLPAWLTAANQFGIVKGW